MAIDVGQMAPDFTLQDSDANEVSLASFRGKKNVILIFYYTAFSSICIKELHELQGTVGEINQKGAEVFLISCDSRQTLRAFKKYEGLAQTLLSDWWPHGQVARSYGVFDENQGGPLRATIV
ncbi:MAG: redoxin domain-containing protein, partial [Chloroflexota bacterium]